MKILHTILDEKFPDSAYELFEATAPGANVFLLPGPDRPLKNLKMVVPKRVSPFAFLMPEFIKWVNSFDALIIHGMKNFDLELIARCRKDLKVYWIGMGFDYYDLIFDSPLQMLKNETRSELARFSKRNHFIGQIVYRNVKNLAKRIVYPRSFNKRSAILRVDYFCPVLESEFAKVKDKVSGFNSIYIDWNYGVSADLVDGKYGARSVRGNNILVGNSATPSNNHLEVFNILKRNDRHISENVKVVVPLSYGDDSYRRFILKKGREILGDRFFPILDMLDPQEYLNNISSCSLVLMNHLRQQAGNNIASALYLGARIILDSRNPFYVEYKANGAILNSMNDLTENPDLLSRPLSGEEIDRNRQLIKKMRGRVTAIAKTRSLISTIPKNL